MLLRSFSCVRCKCFDDDFDSPACSPCQAWEKECEYKTEEGESRWAALNRENRTLEAERDEIRRLFSLIRSLLEAEAQAIFCRIRLSVDNMDLGVFIQQIREDVDLRVGTGQSLQHLQSQMPYVSMRPEAMRPTIYLPHLWSVVGVPRAETNTILELPPTTAFLDA